VAGEGDRQGHGLDREGVGDAGFGQGLDNVGADVEVRKRGSNFVVRLFGGGQRGLNREFLVAVVRVKV
jgi:hypothetical protein